MEINLKENGQTMKKMEEGLINLLMVIITMDIGMMVKEMEEGFTIGAMEIVMMESGKMIKCMAMVTLEEMMEHKLKVNSKMIRKSIKYFLFFIFYNCKCYILFFFNSLNFIRLFLRNLFILNFFFFSSSSSFLYFFIYYTI